MKRWVSLLAGVLSVVLFIALLSPAAADAAAAALKAEYRLTHNTADTTTWHKGAVRFAELVRERTGGKVNIRVYPNAILTGGDQMRQADMAARGVIDFVLTSTLNITPLIPQFAVVSLPYLFNGYADVDRAFSGPAGKRLDEIMARYGLVNLAWGENGFRELTNSVRPIRTPADLKGLKIRVAVPIQVDILNALGANAIQMQWGEVYTALQQKVIDGQENPIGAVIIPQRVYEVQKYMTVWHYSYDALFLAVGKPTWDSFPPDIQQVIRQAAKEAMQYQVEISRQDTASGVDFLRKQGMEVYEPTPAEIQPFRDAAKPAFDKWAARVGPDLVALFEQAREAR
ncbi:DctP family TRAP transporter solute-binding subunit [Carboxydochorda subterranea]|uniref:DctP family TRAP transporter solute-binding subunit n=1 Tax=Carboxydichorda subterranea TaxID=3109565 RepID=A0ABZ1BVP3_9FIRM|nr:DctP family TRAP transporter solute-binding subunit [Limnochorda sp. L945t]WRP16855.1 DctP family TRAP transporter solute-binding subunit [Limnochorda sp. L945t]